MKLKGWIKTWYCRNKIHYNTKTRWTLRTFINGVLTTIAAFVYFIILFFLWFNIHWYFLFRWKVDKFDFHNMFHENFNAKREREASIPDPPVLRLRIIWRPSFWFTMLNSVLTLKSLIPVLRALKHYNRSTSSLTVSLMINQKSKTFCFNTSADFAKVPQHLRTWLNSLTLYW